MTPSPANEEPTMFIVEALDPQGARKTLTVKGPSKSAVIDGLAARGFIVISATAYVASDARTSESIRDAVNPRPSPVASPQPQGSVGVSQRKRAALSLILGISTFPMFVIAMVTVGDPFSPIIPIFIVLVLVVLGYGFLTGYRVIRVRGDGFWLAICGTILLAFNLLLFFMMFVAFWMDFGKRHRVRDEGRLREVAMQVLMYALDHSSASGPLSVEALVEENANSLAYSKAARCSRHGRSQHYYLVPYRDLKSMPPDYPVVLMRPECHGDGGGAGMFDGSVRWLNGFELERLWKIIEAEGLGPQ